MTSGPHLPLGFDSGLDDLLCDPSLLYGFEMTGLSPFDDEPMLWDPNSPNETTSSGGAKSQSHQASAGASSRSPAGSSLIYTPGSTQLDYQEVDCFVDPESEEASTSPDSASNSAEDYVYADALDGHSNRGNRRINTRLARYTRPSPQPLLPLTSPHPRSTVSGQHWQTSFTSTSSMAMDDSAQHARYVSSAEMEHYARTSDDLVSNVGDFDASFPGPYPGQGLPFRALHNDAGQRESSGSMPMQSQAMAHFPIHSHNTTGYLDCSAVAQYQTVGFVTPDTPQYVAGLQARDDVYNQYLRSISHNPALPPSNFELPVAASSILQPMHPTSSGIRPSHSHVHQHPMQAHANVKPTTSSNNPPFESRLDADGLQAEAMHALANRSSGSKNQPESSQRAGSSYVRDHADRVRKGGRSRNSHLTEKSRVKSSVMRRVGACWRCAMQRDPVSSSQKENEPRLTNSQVRSR